MTVHCPALRPSHPLGYLAALGALRLLTAGSDPSARLSWTVETTPAAQLYTRLDLEAVIDGLAATWRQQAAAGAAHIGDVMGYQRPLPPRERIATLPKAAGMNDPAKLHATLEYPAYATADDRQTRQWAQALGTDVVIDTERGAIRLSDLYLLSRQQRLDQQLTALLDLADDAPTLLRESLTAWRRRQLKSGMNWDIRGNRNAAETSSGMAETRIVPGATWLAINALPFFPVGVTNDRVTTRSAQRHRRDTFFLLPCWRQPLDIPAVEVILDHPDIEMTSDKDGTPHLARRRGQPEALDALGVHAVYVTKIVRRRVGGQTERYLDTTALLPRAPD